MNLIDQITCDPLNAPIHSDLLDRVDLVYHLALVANDTNFGAFIAYSYRLSPEMAVVLTREALRRNERLSYTDAFTDFAICISQAK